MPGGLATQLVNSVVCLMLGDAETSLAQASAWLNPKCHLVLGLSRHLRAAAGQTCPSPSASSEEAAQASLCV